MRERNNTEELIYELHKDINARGVMVDTQLLDGAVAIITQMRLRARMTLRRLTGDPAGDKPKPFAAWLSKWLGREVGVSSEDLDTIVSTDSVVMQAINARKILNRTSLSKFQAIADRIDADGRLRNMYVYQGALTGRWTSVNVQLHNLPRSGMTEFDLENAVNIISTGDYSQAYKAYGQKLPDVLASLVRACFVAPAGKLLAVADYSAIESRVLAWLADENWKLEVFAKTGRIYEATASRMFGVAESEVTPEMRACGKIADLALGFGGGIGALERMGGGMWSMARKERIVRSWRDANVHICRYWSRLEGLIRGMVEGERRVCGKIMLEYKLNALIVSLPSGRLMIYPGIKKSGRNMSYMQDGVVKKIYGGLLTENIVQAIARDILAEAMLRVDTESSRIVMHTHDELVVEVGENYVLRTIAQRMEQVPAWAEGLPLRVEEFVTRHYRK